GRERRNRGDTAYSTSTTRRIADFVNFPVRSVVADQIFGVSSHIVRGQSGYVLPLGHALCSKRVHVQRQACAGVRGGGGVDNARSGHNRKCRSCVAALRRSRAGSIRTEVVGGRN